MNCKVIITLFIVLLKILESDQKPIDSDENSDEFEKGLPSTLQVNLDEYEEFLDEISRLRSTRGTVHDFNPIIENKSLKGRDDLKEFRQFQTELNKQKKVNPSGRFVRQLGDFRAVLSTTNNEQIRRDDFTSYRDFQRQLNQRNQDNKPKSRKRRENRFKRMLVFRPLFVYRDQEYKRQNYGRRNLDNNLIQEGQEPI